MGNKVFANDREISCKEAMGKSIAAFPDVCLSPPSPPAGPLPLPYPVTAMASDSADGTKHVKIGGKEVMLKDQSNFKKCVGDEAATKTLGMGVITHNITGAVYFTSWSMDVKIEGQNAVRHLDLVTHNHMCKPGQTPPWLYADGPAVKGKKDPCKKNKEAVATECAGKEKKSEHCPKHNPPKEPPGRPKAKNKKSAAYKTRLKKYKATAAYKKWNKDLKKYYNDCAEKNAADPCLRALRCMLVAWKKGQCCPGQTPHHLVEKASFKGVSGYDAKEAPCVCVEGASWHQGSHQLMHTMQGDKLKRMKPKGAKTCTLGQSSRKGAEAVREVFPESGCTMKCLLAQIKKGHKPINDSQVIQKKPSGYTEPHHAAAATTTVAAKTKSIKNGTIATW